MAVTWRLQAMVIYEVRAHARPAPVVAHPARVAHADHISHRSDHQSPLRPSATAQTKSLPIATRSSAALTKSVARFAGGFFLNAQDLDVAFAAPHYARGPAPYAPKPRLGVELGSNWVDTCPSLLIRRPAAPFASREV